MSRYCRFRRLAALAVCVGSTTAIAALGSAGSAMAEVKCTVGPLYGSGSSFQNTAQKVFKEHWAAFTECEAKKPPSITYTATSSGEGLEVFGMGNAKGEKQGTLLPKQDTLVKEIEKTESCKTQGNKGPFDAAGECLDIFVGTDIGPTEKPPGANEQLGAATTAAGGKSNTGTVDGLPHRAAIVIPVAQAPVTIMLSLPASCRVSNGKAGGSVTTNLNNVTLGQIWEGKTVPGAHGAGDPGGIQAQGGFLANTWGAYFTQRGYVKVATQTQVEEENRKNKPAFTESPAVEETLTRFKTGAKEEVTVHSKEQIEKNEPAEKVTVENQEKVKMKGEGCGQEIKAQVRSSESGTTYATKGYFQQIDPTVYASLWSDAATWPEEGGVTRKNPGTTGKEEILNKKGSQLAESTAATPGSFGYADTADAALKGGFAEFPEVTQRPTPATDTVKEVVAEGEAENKTTKAKETILKLNPVLAKSIQHQIVWAHLQNTGTGAATNASEYVNPLKTASGAAHLTNCETKELVEGDSKFPKHWTQQWNGVITSDPNIATSAKNAADYPVCAITYDVTWHHFRDSNLYENTAKVPTKLAEEMATTAKDYFSYVTDPAKGGSELENAGFYTVPPRAFGGAIRAAVKAIEP
jgi:hypothetical protein